MEDYGDEIGHLSAKTAHLPRRYLHGPSSGSNQSLNDDGLAQVTENIIQDQGAGSILYLQKPARPQSLQLGPRYPPSTSSPLVSQSVAGHVAIFGGESNRSEKKHQCSYCQEKRYQSTKSLRNHFKKEHSQLKFCNVYPCGREFDTDEKLREHKRKNHTQEEIDKLTLEDGNTFCPFCEKLMNVHGIFRHLENCIFRPEGQEDVWVCDIHSVNFYFGSAEKKAQHDEKVHKNHYGFT
ncbi:Hypothetical predicted protein [Cloeon dipterum]|nr:Hypothetical predicted protein [Cloeon dipterum]